MRTHTTTAVDPTAARALVRKVRVPADDNFCDALLRTGRAIIFTSRRENVVGIVSVDRASGAQVSIYTLPSPMGTATRGGTLAIGVATGIRIFEDISCDEQGTYHPVSHIETGAISIHDLAWDGTSRLLFVNTLFSAVCSASLERHFDVEWTPSFIRSVEPSDRCHLNGFALEHGALAYVTALSPGHKSQSWKHEGPDQGVLIDTVAGTSLGGLSLPHSPVFLGNDLWYLESGRGQLCRLDRGRNIGEPVATCSGFARGLAFTDDMALVGISIIKSTNNLTEQILRERFGNLANGASIELAALSSGRVVGRCELAMVEQISSLALLSSTDPCLLTPNAAESQRAFVFGGAIPQTSS